MLLCLNLEFSFECTTFYSHCFYFAIYIFTSDASKISVKICIVIYFLWLTVLAVFC